MWKNRVAWLCLTVAAAALHLFGDNAGTFAAVGIALLAPLVSTALAAVMSRKISVRLTAPDSCDAGDEIRVELETKSSILRPEIDCRITFSNIFAGERFVRSITTRGGAASTLAVVSNRCGRMVIAVDRLSVRDPLGLVRLRARATDRRETLIMPRRFETRIALADDVDTAVESDEYSMTKAGGDPSETFGVREYQPGDPIKQIHWKLSQKSPNLMIRELGLPIVRRALILLETAFPEGEDPRPEPLHAAAEVFFSISTALCEREVAHVAAWRRGETLVCREISAVEDAVAAAAEWLSEPPASGGRSTAELFAETFERCGYAHVAAVAPCAPRGVERLYGGNRVTALCSYGGAGLEGVHLRVFDEKDPAADLREWEF